MGSINSISDLNKKVWYRIVKVLYFGAFLASLVTGGFIVYQVNIYHPYNEQRTRITCHGRDSNHATEEIFKSTYSISGKILTQEQRDKIAIDICGMPPEPRKAYEYGHTYNIMSELLLSENDVFSASSGIMETRLAFGVFIFQLFICSLGIMCIFEAIRRVFYYIALGKIMPKS